MPALDIKNLSKTYRRGPKALDNINISIQEGDFFALLGPNGAGKSTLIGILSSLVNKGSGNILIFGHDLHQRPDLAKPLIGVVPQEFNFGIFETVTQILVNQAGYFGIPEKKVQKHLRWLLESLDLWDKRNMQTRTLSGGMKRRLMIARGLIHKPKVFFLDEPTAGVDVELRRGMWDFFSSLNKTGITIILTTHYLEEAEHLCRNLAIIDKGRIIEVGPMNTMVSKLDIETFILDLKIPGNQDLSTLSFQHRYLDEQRLEVRINRSQSINSLFQELTKAGVIVMSLKNKSNRLEEFFLYSVENKPKFTNKHRV